MSLQLPRISISSCPKAYNTDLDKARPPQETLDFVLQKLAGFGSDIYAGSQRVDRGRLGIPIYMGLCGQKARAIMPTRKQMGKGSSKTQAQASALMEVMERFAFFSFWQNSPHFRHLTWSEAKKEFQARLLPVSQMLTSVNDTLDPDTAESLLDLLTWQFYPATALPQEEITWLPLDWFRLLGEFNGSSAGNSTEESLLQGLSELIERHVCARIAAAEPELPTIGTSQIDDPVLAGLIAAFRENGIQLVLKDFSFGMPVPTIGALAWDPATFPTQSEIVFTAGTATSPAKAAIRAITEVAQLGGDFCTSSCYEASGLPKYASLEDCAWLTSGPVIRLSALPSIACSDMGQELHALLQGLAPIQVYAVELTHPKLAIPAHYCMAPGLQFRERDKNQSLGLFIGRKLAEEAPPEKAAQGLQQLARVYGDAHFLPFFHGLLAMRQNMLPEALAFFNKAIPVQPDSDSAALASFYAAYAHTLQENWQAAIPFLKNAQSLSPQMKEACNLMGVAFFKLRNYEQAELCFNQALGIDKGSAMDLANRGLARKFQGKFAEAYEDLQTALELDPSLDFARTHLLEISRNHAF